MEQNYYLMNFTRLEEINIGKFDKCFQYYIAKLGWKYNDRIVAFGESGDQIIHNDPTPSWFSVNLNSSDTWEFLCFVAEKLKVKPSRLWDEYEHSGSVDPEDIKYLGHIRHFEKCV